MVPYSVVRRAQRRRPDQHRRRAVPAAEISAMILQKLKADAEAKLGETVDSAVITVPAYFTDAQRKATKDAGSRRPGRPADHQRADRRRRWPTGSKRRTTKTVLIYDLGGGTFDVSVLEMGEGVLRGEVDRRRQPARRRQPIAM